ncbi:nuclear transport factor 2-like isoform X2 [Lycium ferocissimum]|uniref:nuclear transport factor 2-like isoform X2 n=1 Tax=Lycium ferocissimum TaxID=112874 RepID=UPI002815C823|nr:nuclear transport factor 2-like isoform X2 [Lycium ferocissimum]
MQRAWKVYVHGCSASKNSWYCIDLEGDEKRISGPLAVIESEREGGWALMGDHIYWSGAIVNERYSESPPEHTVSVELTRHNITSPDPFTWETMSLSSPTKKKLPVSNPCAVPLDDDGNKKICLLGGRMFHALSPDRALLDVRHYGEVYNLETQTWHPAALHLHNFTGDFNSDTCALMEKEKVVICYSLVTGFFSFYDVRDDSFRTEFHPHFVTLGGGEVGSIDTLRCMLYNIRPVVSNSKLYWLTYDLFLVAYDFVQQKWFQSQYLKELESWGIPCGLYPYYCSHLPILVDLYNGEREEFLVLVNTPPGKLGMAFLDVSKGFLNVNVKSRHTFSLDDPQFHPRQGTTIMTMQAEGPPSAQVVGNAFVEQYNQVQHHTPEFVYRVYQDSSVLGHPDSNGVMSSVTTIKNINDMICSLDYKNYKAEIKTADAQESFKDGVIVLVTGCLTGKDNLRRKFTHTFFLAPRNNGYFVLNDVFRYVEENETDTVLEMINGTEDVQSEVLTPDPEEVQHVEEKANDSLEDGRRVGDEREIVAKEDAPKKSYVSIVSSQTKKGPTKIYVPTNTSRTAQKAVKQPVAAVALTPAPEASNFTGPNGTNVPETNHNEDDAEGHSIFVRNLPLDVTVAQLEAEFKRYGPIKQGGLQVRSNRQQGFCFGFVEFKDESSMHGAIQDSPITIGGRQAVVEMKRTTTRAGSARGRFRNDNFRGRGNFGGGWSYGRNEYGGRNFSGRGRGQGG